LTVSFFFWSREARTRSLCVVEARRSARAACLSLRDERGGDPAKRSCVGHADQLMRDKFLDRTTTMARARCRRTHVQVTRNFLI
jgi:hypothetical protein